MKTLFNLSGFLFSLGLFLLGLWVLSLLKDEKPQTLALGAQISQKQEIQVFTEPVFFQGSDPLTKKLTSLVKKMRRVSYEENGIRASYTKEGGYLSFNEDKKTYFFSYEFQGNIISYEIPKMLTYSSGTSQVLDEEILPLTPVELTVLVNQELLE